MASLIFFSSGPSSASTASQTNDSTWSSGRNSNINGSISGTNGATVSGALALSLATGPFEENDGYEGSAGFSTTVACGTQSLYPDTVPQGQQPGATDFTAMTNDLRRAIGGMRVDDSAKRNGKSYQEDGMSAGSNLKLPVGPKQGENGIAGPSRVPDDLVLEGNLEILGRLGEGASGEVKKARHVPTGLLMAKKTIATSPNPAIHRQILRELSFIRTCHSDHIVRYYGAFLEDEDTSIAICMEYCEAGSLAAIYKRVKARGGRTGEKILGKISECVLKGLGYLHERKIIHRDIKPSNIVVTRQGQIKLCDFGVSGELINSMAGTFTGTSYYMAPERIQGLPYTISSDVWSLGLTILELASNRFPFPPEGEPPLGPIDLLSYVISMKVPELQDDESVGVKWSKALRDFIARCLEKDGIKRPGPIKMMSHPFVKKSQTRVPQPDLARFVAEVWGWPEPDSHGSVSTHNTPTSTEPLLPIGRTFSLRQAPKPSEQVGVAEARAQAAAPSTSSSSISARPAPDAPTRLSVAGLGPVNLRDLEGRTAADRTAAKMREADLGLVGSPTEEYTEPHFNENS
ncbi:Pkinase-domain-containing protein [Tilletiaria anomala UBC 951]|uniref:Pkinase-domain-containing protein n=1 Tax=Tilletiaria anomala (strain ATCC 24038 / CBS 436.72 / UBC 951) TaxID=1037660 RepID=A0A066VD93_TILAU|nr:Pkinase-domain-containing protein [Tilletiaria anomala UBC 951]KDN39406.1 Pkinase-domain-containing protein [Tilletiaria anomala UBC 951]